MADDINNPQQPPKKLIQQLQEPESKKYLDELNTLSTDPEYARGVPEDSRRTLQEAIAAAKQAYEDKVTKNEWLDVAQTLGRAVTQFGAAQTGMKTGHDMSNLNMGQPIDYNNRSDRAFREYSQDLKNIGETDALNRQKFADESAQKEEGYKRRSGYLGEALKSAREHENLQSQETRTDAREKARQASEDRRFSEADKRAAEREANSIKKMDINDLNHQESALQNKLQAARSLANNVVNEDDLHKKSRDKLNEKYGAQAAQAGIDPDVLRQIGEQSKDEGVMGSGLFRGEDKEKKSQLLNEQVIAPIKNMLDAIQARKQELLRGKSPVAESATTPPPAPPPSANSGMVKMKSPDGKEGQIPASKVKDAEAKGFTRI